MLEPTDKIFFNFVSSPLCTFISSFLSSLCSHLKTHPNSHPVRNYFNLSLLSSLCSHLRTHPPHNSHPININFNLSLLSSLYSHLFTPQTQIYKVEPTSITLTHLTPHGSSLINPNSGFINASKSHTPHHQ